MASSGATPFGQICEQHAARQLAQMCAQRVAQHTAQRSNLEDMITALKTVATVQNLVIDDQFRTLDRNQWRDRWHLRLLCLLRPFYSIFGRDTLSHYRINNVADAILKTCKANEAFREPQLQLLKKGIDDFNRRTKGKHVDCLNDLKSEIETLVAPKRPLPDPRSSCFGDSRTDAIEEKEEPTVEAPSSHIRGTTLVGVAVTPFGSDTQLKWPSQEEIEGAGMDVAQMELLQIQLDRLVGQCLSHPERYMLRFVKTGKGEEATRELQLIQRGEAGEEIVERIKTPVSLEIVYKDGHLQDVILLTKLVVAVGGETKVRLCFSLFEGTQLVRKKCSGKLQQQLLTYYRNHPSRGIVQVRGMRESQLGNKVQSLEDFWLWDLRGFIDSSKGQPRREVPTFAARLKIAQDILHGVAAIHRNTCDQYTSSDGVSVAPFQMFHLDITPQNVLINPTRENENTPGAAAITDVGCAHPENIGGTAGFKAPEQVRLCHKYKGMSTEDIIQYNIRYGQQSDVWSTGLVLCVLFAWEMGSLGAPPLPCIDQSVQMGESRNSKKPLAADQAIGRMHQGQINDDLLKLKGDCIRQVHDAEGSKQVRPMATVWDVIGEMLQVNPEERITIHEALQRLEALQVS